MRSTTPEPEPAAESGPDSAPSADSATPGLPRPLHVLSIAGVIEAGALAVAGGFALWEMTRPQATIAADLFLAALAWGMALLLVLSVRGLRSGQRWARSPMMTWQLFQIVIAVTWLTSAPHVGAFVLLALALLVMWALMTRAVVTVTAGNGAA